MRSNGLGWGWLLAISSIAMAVGCKPARETPSSGANEEAAKDVAENVARQPGATPGVWFRDVAADRGLVASHAGKAAESYFFPASMSPGAAWIDYDRDGDLDALVAVGAGDWPSRVRLFQQDDQHRFRDATDEAGLRVKCEVQGFAVGDVDNDGYDDLLITAYRGDRLLKNQRGSRFEDITESSGIGRHGWSTSAAFFDFDRDGRLDLFVCQYVDYDPTRPCFGANGRQDFCNPAMFERTPDRLYRNMSDESGVKFEDHSERSGIAHERGAGLGVVCGDFNGDQWPDIYVANDGHANFLWINQRDGAFRDEAVPLGAAYDLVGRGQGSMGVAAEDVNHDGALDLFATNLDGESNALYLSDSQGGFVESSALAQVARPSYAFTGFGTTFLDVENDGDLDLVVANGRVRRQANVTLVASSFWDDYAERSHLYLNDGTGKFALAAGDADPLLSKPAVLRGLAAGDFDADGRVDLLVSAVEGPVRLYRNSTTQVANWVSLKLVDPRRGGRVAIGASVELQTQGRLVRRQATTCGSYLSAHDGRVHLGLGKVDKVEAVVVTWPEGEREQFDLPVLNRVVVLERGTGRTP
ncbi:MAG: CRTAC1 family protein [Pirellulales bacterium]